MFDETVEIVHLLKDFSELGLIVISLSFYIGLIGFSIKSVYNGIRSIIF